MEKSAKKLIKSAFDMKPDPAGGHCALFLLICLPVDIMHGRCVALRLIVFFCGPIFSSQWFSAVVWWPCVEANVLFVGLLPKFRLLLDFLFRQLYTSVGNSEEGDAAFRTGEFSCFHLLIVV